MLSSRIESLRAQVAAVAARFIAEDGVDYASAKQRALREVIGDTRERTPYCMPDNTLVEAAVREHQALFMADTQPACLLALRQVARDVLTFLARADPTAPLFATGAIVNGTAGEHSDVHLLLHSDNAKDVEIFLVNADIDYEVSEIAGTRGGETLSFLWPQRGSHRRMHVDANGQTAVHLSVLDPRAHRGSTAPARIDLAGLERLLQAAA